MVARGLLGWEGSHMSIDLHEIKLALHAKRNEVANRMRRLEDITVKGFPILSTKSKC